MRLTLARIALILSLLVPIWFMAAALGVKFGLWSWRLGLGVLIVQWGPRLLIGALVLGLVALALTLVRRPRTGWRMALIALVVPILGLGYMGWMRDRSADIPPIHDVATDPDDPPRFSARLLAIREADGANAVVSLATPLSTLKAYQSPRFAEVGDQSLGQVAREAYPDVRTLAVSTSPAQAFAAAEREARLRGWTVVTADPAAGVIQATAETFWFGFKDDLAIRVRPARAGAGSLIDVRSTSRVGLSDLGTNAARIRAYLADISRRTSPA